MAAEIQHKDARKLVRMFASGRAQGSELTYGDVSLLLGRGDKNNSRAVAGICNLIDAASCWAGTPLLALGRVKNADHETNPKAWAKFNAERRKLVVKRSTEHQFTKSNYETILVALDDLKGLGGRRAWFRLERTYSPESLYRRLIGDFGLNSVVDLEGDPGTDAPDRAEGFVSTYKRDEEVRRRVLHRANGHCEYCGVLGFEKRNGDRYLETHHVIALAKQGQDRMTNVLALCANDHREAHFAKDAEAIEAEMLEKLAELNRTSRSHKSL